MNSQTTNPYVGLRPFEVDESILFFGRNELILELLQRLHQHKYVAVIGGSGSGKSSLIRAGLIPALKAGYLVDNSDHWLIAIMKPGQQPVYNLAASLLLQIDDNSSEAQIETLLNQIEEEGANAIITLLSEVRKKNNTNFFLLVDQFEELFRFAMESGDALKKDEAIDFVNIMLQLSQQDEIPIFVISTMRSDFIGDCTQFYGLPEAMNKSQYLVPKMNRLQLRKVIEAPAKLFGKKVESSLTSRLLNDLGKVEDELPLLQHVLMRIWDYSANQDQNESLDLNAYKQVGGIKKALSIHADEALKEMSDSQKSLAKKMFQVLTKIDANTRKTRRPLQLFQLVKLTNASEAEIMAVVNLFIKDKRCFLMISKSGDDISVDISHESLIRQWKTLIDWIKDEQKNVSNYMQLRYATSLHAEGKRGYLSGIELDLASKWRKDFNPQPSWANLYNEGYKSCIDYLEASELEHEIELKKEKNRKRTSIIFKAFAFIVVLGFISVFLINRWNKIERENSLLELKTKKDSLNIVKTQNEINAIQNELKEYSSSNIVESIITLIVPDNANKNLIVREKILPYDTDKTLVVIAEERSTEENKVKRFWIHIVLFDIKTTELLNRDKLDYFYAIDDVTIDTARYILDEDSRAFGVRIKHSKTVTENHEEIEVLNLLIPAENNEFNQVLDHFTTVTIPTNNPDCLNNNEVRNTLEMTNTKTNGYYNIKVKTYTKSYENEKKNGECITIKTEESITTRTLKSNTKGKYVDLSN